jgi:hypothetical protein
MVSVDSDQARLQDSAPSLPGKGVSRRSVLGTLAGALVAGTQAACFGPDPSDPNRWERTLLEFQEFVKKNFRVMTDVEKSESIARLERLSQLEHGVPLNMSGESAQEGVLYGYAFNISKCKGYRECVRGCVEENNQDRASGIQYIRIFEMEGGEVNFEEATAEFQHEVPREGHFYLGTQCFQCHRLRLVHRLSLLHRGVSVLGSTVQLVRARGAPGADQSQPALPGESAPEEGLRREVHVLYPADPEGPESCLHGSLPHRSQGLWESAGSGLGDPLDHR